jgi:phospholipid/cholesterol/gamma-HCH transport system permease protein
MLREKIEQIGAFAINKWLFFKEFFFFVVRFFKVLFSSDIRKEVVLDVMVMQIYFTAVQLLAFFLMISVIIGTVFIGVVLSTVKNLGLSEFLGDIIVVLVALEIGPLITVLLIALRSSSAINTEIAVMVANGEIDSLKAFDIDEMSYLYIPRIVSVTLCVLVMSTLFSIIALLSGFLFSFTIFDISAAAYSELIANSITLRDVGVLGIKSVVMGFFISIIPIFYGSRTSRQFNMIPVSVLKGMMSVFSSIVIVEAILLTVKLI